MDVILLVTLSEDVFNGKVLNIHVNHCVIDPRGNCKQISPILSFIDC